MTEDLYNTKRSLELEWQQEHLKEGKYTLVMVRIDDKIKEIITQIKLEEARLANLQNAVEESKAEVSIAT